VAEVLSRAAQIVSLVALSRLLGPTDFGRYAIVLAVLAYAGVATDAGLTALTTRRIVETPEATRLLVGATLVLQVTAAMAVTAVVTVGVVLLTGMGGTGVAVLVGLPIVLAQAVNVSYVLLARQAFPALATFRAALQVGTTGLSVGAAVLSGELLLVLCAPWIAMLLADACLLLHLKRKELQPMRPPPTMLRSLMRQSLPYFGNGMLLQAVANLEVLVLGALAAPSEVGQYAGAYRVTFAFLSVAGVAVGALLPSLITAYTLEGDRFHRSLQRLTQLALLSSLPLYAFILTHASSVMNAAVGPGYQESGHILQVLFVWIPLGWLSTLLGQVLLVTGRQSRVLAVAASSAVVLAAALLFLVPTRGATGAAIAVVVAEVCTAGMLLAAARHHYGFSLLPDVLRCLPVFVAGVVANEAFEAWLSPAGSFVCAAVFTGALILVASWRPLRALREGALRTIESPNSQRLKTEGAAPEEPASRSSTP
jgi:O-antigen/teichoic acid export membrane protein